MSVSPLSDDLPPAALRVLHNATASETIHRGTRMVWHSWGCPTAPPVILLHGGSGSWTHWVRNVEAIANTGRRVIVPDLPGFGDSVAAPDITDVDGMVAPVVAGMLEIGAECCFDIVGFSLGGMLAALIAAAHPHQVRRIIFVGAPALGAVRFRGLQDWRHLQSAEARDQAHRYNLSAMMLYDSARVDDFAVRLHAANLARDRVRQRRISRSDILARMLPTLRCRMDGIWGEFDHLCADRMHDLQEFLGSLPSFRDLVFIPRAGHWVQFENAENFNEVLIRLISDRQVP